MNMKTPANMKHLSALGRKGEGPTIEFKRSTGDRLQKYRLTLAGERALKVRFGRRNECIEQKNNDDRQRD